MTNTTLPSADRSQSHARLVRDLFTEVVERGHHEHLRDWLAPSFPGGAEGFLTGVAPLRAAFPDIRYTLDPVVAAGDRVALAFRWTGTHRGTFRGIAPTGRVVESEGMAVFTFEDARVARVALQTDRLGFLQQLGVVAPDPLASAAPPAPVIDVGRARSGVYLVDTFRVPAASYDALIEATRDNRAFIRTLPGFRGDAILVKRQGDARYDLVTIAAWESREAIAHARAEVEAHYARIGFDPREALARWGATLERAICDAPPELQ